MYTKQKKQEILQSAPEGATHYSPESDNLLEAYFKNDFTQVWVTNDGDKSFWDYWEETWFDGDEVVVKLEDLK